MKKILRQACVVGIVAAAALYTVSSAWASEPVSRQYILGELVPINEDAEYRVRSIDLDIAFGYDSAKLTDAAKQQLDELGAALNAPELAKSQFGINGHTDAKGKAEYNKLLSERRATSVAVYLSETFDIDPTRLVAKGLGEEELKNAENPNAAENRRVEIVNLTPIPQPQKTRKPLSAPSLGGFQKPVEQQSQPFGQAQPPVQTPAPGGKQGGAIVF